MILDKQNLFSDAQAITASAASENYVDMGAREIAFGDPVEIFIGVEEAFTNLTSLTIAVQTDDEITFSGATTLVSETILLANLTAGARANLKFMPKGNLGYMRLYYTVTGSAPDAGKITAGIVAATSEGHHDIPAAVAGS